MFGPRISVINTKSNQFKITMGPIEKKYASVIAENFSNIGTVALTATITGKTEEDEMEWLEKIRRDKTCMSWGIFADDKLIGTTGLHNKSEYGTCESGIAIWDKSFHGKGIGSGCHIARTMYAVLFWNISIIHTHLFCENTPSLKALQSVGYSIDGVETAKAFRWGRFMDGYKLLWINPRHASVVFPNGIPEKFLAGIEVAQKMMNTWETRVTFM